MFLVMLKVYRLVTEPGYELPVTTGRDVPSETLESPFMVVVTHQETERRDFLGVRVRYRVWLIWCRRSIPGPVVINSEISTNVHVSYDSW